MQQSLILAILMATCLSTLGCASEKRAGTPASSESTPCCHASGTRQHVAEGPVIFFSRLFDTADYPRRWICGTWSSDVGWLHIMSDLAIFAAYLAIPVVLLSFLLRKRELPFPRVFWLFAAFIFACGLGHLIEATMFWWPIYRFSGLVKLITAIVSWLTVAALIYIAPRALALPGLAVLNKRLEAEVAERRMAQEQLIESYNELEKFTGSALDREGRVLELKREVNLLLAELGRESRYSVQGQSA